MNNIIEKLLTINPYSRPGEKLQSVSKIIIHWIGNPNTSATANRNYFESLKDRHIYASSQYIVGLDGEKIICIPEDEVAYHAGNRTMNRNSIGIEVCHPDWDGKFNDVTYNSLIELVVELVKKYNLKINDIIRHYDVTGKDCPRYYVEHEDEWVKFKNDIANKLNQLIVTEPIDDVKGSEEKPMYKFKNGKTREPIYADSKHTVKIGSLDKYEECDCYGIINGAPMVIYPVGETGNYKVGFAVDIRCVK